MIVRATRPRPRSGITLTEILISILILGVGVTSLATLFPLGLIRLRNAQRLSRGGFLVESAIADLGTRNLLSPLSFIGNANIAQCYHTGSGFYNPWVQDTPSYGHDYYGSPATPTNGIYSGWGGLGTFNSGLPLAFRPGVGVPVAYDPLWRAVANGAGVYPVPLGAAGTPEARFGQGVGFTSGVSSPEWLRLDPDGNPAGAHGLQRITNLTSAFSNVALQTCVSPEDIVVQDPKAQYVQDTVSGAYVDVASAGAITPAATPSYLTSPSTVVPAFGVNPGGGALNPTNDWRFTWLFTGQLADSGNGTVFSGDIVVCENRPFGIDPVKDPFGVAATVFQVSGETVVEAVWGYSGGVTGPLSAANRTVLLRWPTTMPDPDVKVGSWIADVTYVRHQADANSRYGGSIYPAQRCYWYQIAKRTEPGAAQAFTGDPVGYRSMTVWTTTPLRAFTQLAGTTPNQPSHVEAALIMPSVVNVFPRTIYTR